MAATDVRETQLEFYTSTVRLLAQAVTDIADLWGRVNAAEQNLRSARRRRDEARDSQDRREEDESVREAELELRAAKEALQLAEGEDVGSGD